ncbi:porin family protein [Robertkochia marina]|uniref:Porin family protein n=1 Tax=Robertkochia marina TaxID=1227945 RepID=A0A4S3LXI8_9FLAO|nr:porin family protein [Robertkochia marina]THD66268.1 porin family protein [Robertkochia marina]TRZ40906.1 porin family protein [Robertkochia marina]
MKIRLLSFFLFCFYFSLQAQEIRLNTYADYVFQDRFSSYFGNNSYFEGKVEDGFRWGAGVEFLMGQGTALELQYLRQDTKAPTSYRGGGFGSVQFTNFDLGINYIMLNSTRYFSYNKPIEPFLSGGIGLGIFNIKNPEQRISDSATKFAWQIRGGANLWLSPRLAFRVQASLMSVVQAVGGGAYFGTGGSGISFNSYSTIYQFALGGGIVFKIPRG